MKALLINISIAYITLLLFAYVLADHMIFLPPSSGYTDSGEFIKLTTSDGEKIFAYYLPNKKAKYTLLVSHGNAEDIGYMRPFFEEMYKQGYSVFSYDYHGYGLSSGRPTEKNTYLDINAAYDYLTRVLNVSPDRIISFGHSVGAAVALDLAARKPVAGVILQGAFLTAFRVVTKIPIFPFDKFRNNRKIKNIKCPLLMIHGNRDRVIPFKHGKKLYDLALDPKVFYEVQGAGHNDILLVSGEKYWKVMSDFITKYIKR